MSGVDLDVMALRSRDEFDHWLVDDLEARDTLTPLLGVELDTDADSLDLLEEFLLRRYADPDDALRPDERTVLDAAARHIGLVLVLTVDEAGWTIDFEHPDSVYYRLPVVEFADGAQECPLAMATASLDRRTGTYLRGVAENYQMRYNSPSGE